jgi:hypothetical protein
MTVNFNQEMSQPIIPDKELLMRRFTTFLTLIVLLTACRQKPSPNPTNTPAPHDIPQTAEGPISFQESLAQATPTPTPPAGHGMNLPIPRVSWEESPDAKIVSATFCCGPTPEFSQRNYIPDAQIWGNGRVIWVQIQGSTRSVQEGQLTKEQVLALLQSAASLGFFTWEQLYTMPLVPSDLPEKCLAINLTSMTQRVCEYGEGAPKAFHALYDTVARGAGATGNAYLPDKGFLISYPQVEKQPLDPTSVPPWNAEELGLSLFEAADGVWVEGKVLEAAWNLINANLWGSIAEEYGEYYYISLQIPGISMMEPTTP